MIQIDGSAGEGGGQVLRTALGLSLVTGRAFRIRNIRANRKKPGLMRQHLTAVCAAAEMGSARISGAEIGSGRLEFSPGTVRPGRYTFSIGTAGSCTLVLQAVLPPLLVGGHPSEIIIEGGTHNPMAPPFDFLAQTYLPVLKGMGVEVSAELERPGFYPAGGGRMRIKIEPAQMLRPIALTELANVRVSARAVCAGLPPHIGRRELIVVKESLGLDEDRLEQVQLDEYGTGNVLSIFVRSDQLTETFTGFGERHVSAEKVAARTVNEVREYLRTGAPVGIHLADQLLIPMALAGAGCFRTSKPSSHTLTNIGVIRQFLDTEFVLTRAAADTWEVKVSPQKPG